MTCTWRSSAAAGVVAAAAAAAAATAAAPRRSGSASPRPYRDVFTLDLSPTTSLRVVLTADADVPVSAAPAAGPGGAAAAAAAADAAAPGVLPGLLARHGRSLGRLPASLLKSALQKAIRRQRPRAAAVAALGLGARTTAADLLRRLTLIGVEDVAVWPGGYPPLVWLLMAAGRRAVLGGRVVDWVLYAAAVMAAVEVRDAHADGPGGAAGGGGVKAAAEGKAPRGADGGGAEGGAAPAVAGPPDAATPARPAPPTADAACLVGALQVRRVYGGSPGDVALVAAAEAAWAARFAAAAADGGGGAPPPALVAAAAAYARAAASVTARDVSLQALAVPTAPGAPLLPPGSVRVEAVDSHCSAAAEELADTLPPGVVATLAALLGDGADPGDGVRVVERATWRCRSGLNGRRQWVGGGGGGAEGDACEPGGDPALMAYWEAEVRPAVDEWSRAFLATRGL